MRVESSQARVAHVRVSAERIHKPLLWRLRLWQYIGARTWHQHPALRLLLDCCWTGLKAPPSHGIDAATLLVQSSLSNTACSCIWAVRIHKPLRGDRCIRQVLGASGGHRRPTLWTGFVTPLSHAITAATMHVENSQTRAACVHVSTESIHEPLLRCLCLGQSPTASGRHQNPALRLLLDCCWTGLIIAPPSHSIDAATMPVESRLSTTASSCI